MRRLPNDMSVHSTSVDPELMRRALDAARRGAGRTRPNPMVGSVIAKDGRVIAEAHHERAGGPHAEVGALRKAGARARGADLYVTLEPCNHHGRTPPCTDALIASGVRRVIVGARDPNPLVHGKGIRRLRRAGIEVVMGVLAEECRSLNRAFAHYIGTREPYVIAKLAESLDGRVATRTRESKWITGPAARREGHALRDVCDAIVVGVGTVLADDPALTCRLRGGRDPVRVIVDTEARTPPKAQVVRLARSSTAPTWIAVGEGAPARRVAALERAGAEVLRCKVRGGHVDLRDLSRKLGERELLSILVEGGPTLLGGFVDAGLVHEVYAFVAPLILGGEGALGAVGARGAARLGEALRLSIGEVRQVGDDLLVIARRPGRKRRRTPKF